MGLTKVDSIVVNQYLDACCRNPEGLCYRQKTAFQRNGLTSNRHDYKQESATQTESIGVAKAGFSISKTLVLAVLAGAFIAFGSIFFTTVTTAYALPFGMT